MQPSKIENIVLEDKKTWDNRTFITLDIDWCHDDILSDTVELLKKYNVPATFFVTHETDILADLRKNPLFELGIHPNFNRLLSGNHSLGSNFQEVIEHYMKIVPDSKVVRSHSMTQNSPILDSFREFGLTHDCNHFIPFQSGMEMKPWKLWNDLIKVPYCWEDDVTCLFKDYQLAPVKGVSVYDFHPIHIFLNSYELSTYESTREHHRNPATLVEHRDAREGTRNLFINLLEKCNESN